MPSPVRSKPSERRTALRRRPAPPRVDIGAIRREQIVDAATDIIASRGIQHLSLSAIEAGTGMSRGQLTYYFKAKEEILLAVFDRTVERMQERMAADHSPECDHADVLKLVESLLSRLLTKPIAADFAQLQYSFLAQTRARPDFRDRLAALYDQWRSHMATGFQHAALAPGVDPRLLASFVQALLHGLVMQLQADPNAFDGPAMFHASMELLRRLFQSEAKPARNGRSSSPAGVRRHG